MLNNDKNVSDDDLNYRQTENYEIELVRKHIPLI